MDESPVNIKYLLLVPTQLNDGSDVPKSVFLELEDTLFEHFDGCTIGGTVRGAYKMQDGKKAIDHSVVWWIVIREGQYNELREIVAKLGQVLGQESMYLEKTGSTIDFVEPFSGEPSGDKE